MAMVAEEERRMISERTKALAATKGRGVKLGGYRASAGLTAKARKAATRLMLALHPIVLRILAPAIAELQASGATSLRAIADGLNARGIPTARGGKWSAVQVDRVISRLLLRRNAERCARAGQTLHRLT
jgi:DNA invertase Pin-like site-specific DNA recombinase